MNARLISTDDLARQAGISVGYCRNLIAGVDVAVRGRSRIEAVLGVKIWPKPGEGEPISDHSGETDVGGGGESDLQHPSKNPPRESNE